MALILYTRMFLQWYRFPSWH